MGHSLKKSGSPNLETSQLAFRLHDDENGIDIKGWTIRVVQDAIATSAVEEKLSQDLGIKLPGMLFDKSSLSLKYKIDTGSIEEVQTEDVPSFQLNFNTVDALKMVGEADPNIKVKAAERWGSKKERPGVEITTIERASDWTFSTRYAGTINVKGSRIRTDGQYSENFALDKEVVSSDGDGTLVPINFNTLSDTTLPILFTSQVILFEDELDDNGTASYKVRIRVMPTFFFILARFFLRVDGVLVRIYDTRYYHEFDRDIVVQESVTREASLSGTLKDVHPSILRDPDILAQRLPVCSSKLLNIRLSPLEPLHDVLCQSTAEVN